MEQKRTTAAPTNHTLKTRLFLNNNSYLRTLATTPTVAALVIVVQNLQLLALTSNPANRHVEEWISTGLSYLNLEAVRSQPMTLSLTISFTTVANLALLLALFVKGIPEALRTWIARALQLYCLLAVVPNIGNFLHAIFRGEQLIYVALFGLLLQLLLNFNDQLLYFNFSFNCKDSLRRNPHTSLQYWARLFVVMVGSLPVLRQYQAAVVSLVIINVAYGILSIRTNYTRSTYNHASLGKLDGVLQVLVLGINCCYLLMWLISIDMIERNRLVLLFVTQLFVLVFFLNFRNFHLKSLINDDSRISNELEADLFFKSYLSIFKAVGGRKERLYISSLLKMHINQCEDGHCCCKRRNQLYDPINCTYGNDKAQPHQDLVFVKHYLLKLLEGSLSKFPASALLILDTAFYRLEVLGLYCQTAETLAQLRQAEKKSRLSISEQFLVFQLEKLLVRTIEEKNCKETKASVPIENIRIFDERVSELLQQVVAATNNFSEMWQLLSEDHSNVKSLSVNCQRNLGLILQIDRNYRQVVQLNSFSSQLRDLMELYSKFVLFDYQFSTEVAKQIRDSLTEQRFNQTTELKLSNAHMFAQNTCMLNISHEPSTTGRVLWASKSIHAVTGYHREELLKSSINRILPSVFSRFHNEILLNWRNKGIEFSINNFKETWALDFEGYCFGCRLYIKVFPCAATADMLLLGFLERINRDNAIVLDEEGDISCVGRDLCELVKLEPAQLSESGINIQLLCVELFNSFKLVEQQPPKVVDHIISENSRQSCMLCIPKKLQTLVKTLQFKKQNLYSSAGLDRQTKNYSELSDHRLFMMRINYLLYLKSQLQLMADEDCEFYRLKFDLNRHQFYDGRSQREYCVISVASIRRNDSLEVKYLDIVENAAQALAKHLTKLRKTAKEMEAHLRESQSSSGVKNVMSVFQRKIDRTTNHGSVKLKKKLASFTVNILRESQSGSLKRIMKKNRRESDFHERLHSKSVDKERVARNVQRVRQSLLREGILSSRMLEIFKMNQQDCSFLKQRLNVFQTLGVKTGLDDSMDFEEESIKSSDKLLFGAAEREQDIKLGSVASSAANISMNSAIKSLKEELRKLRPPKTLTIINRLIIVTTFIFLALFALESLNLINRSQKYSEEVRTAEEAQFMQQRLSMAFDSILLRQYLSGSGNVTQQTQMLDERIARYLTEAHHLLIAHTSQTIEHPMPLTQANLDYMSLEFQNERINNPYRFVLLELYAAYTQLRLSGSVDSPLFHRFATGTYQQFDTVMDKSLEVNFQQIHSEMQTIVQYLVYIVAGENFALLVVLCSLLFLVGRLLRSMMDTLNLFSKVSRKDMQRYSSHFDFLKHRLQSGSKVHEILQELAQEQGTDQPSKLNSKAINRIESSKEASKAPAYLSISAVIVILMVLLTARVLVCWMLSTRFTQVARAFHDIHSEENQLLQRKIQFKLLLNNLTTMSAEEFDRQFNNKQLMLTSRLADSYNIQSNGEGYRSLLMRMISTNVCTEILNLDSPGECETASNGSLTFGIVDDLININTFMYESGARLVSQSSASEVIASRNFTDLETGSAYIASILRLLHEEMTFSLTSNITLLKNIAVYFLCALAFVLLAGMTFGWRVIYNRISKESSFANAFILLMPYNVLKQNPYVKVYIKNEFNVNGLSRM